MLGMQDKIFKLRKELKLLENTVNELHDLHRCNMEEFCTESTAQKVKQFFESNNVEEHYKMRFLLDVINYAIANGGLHVSISNKNDGPCCDLKIKTKHLNDYPNANDVFIFEDDNDIQVALYSDFFFDRE